jgi:glucokinase
VKGWRLLGDIGGTNARFARSESASEPYALRTYNVSDFKDFNQAITRYLTDSEGLQGCESVAVCAAGPVLNGQIKLTNAPWRISASDVSRLAGNVPIVLYNDLEAVALALPHLNNTDVMPIGEVVRLPSTNGRMLAINVGTGFGAALTLPSGGTWVTCPSEAGHMSFGAQNETEHTLLGGESSSEFAIEDVLSGQGLVNLYRNQCRMLGTAAAASVADEVFPLASSDAAAEETLRVFTLWLGRAARNLTLATTAWGGVFFTGGVIQGWSSVASGREFRESFEASRGMQEPLQCTRTAVITHPLIALRGLARARII